jgi:hypothetical protein
MKRIQVVALGTVLCIALAGMILASQAEVYTVGDFAVNLAKMITNKADYTPEQAAAYLEKVGVELGDLDSQVDEEIFVGAFNRLGVNMVTARPDSEVGSDKADRVFQMFDRNDTLFTGELFKVCSGPRRDGDESGQGEPSICVTDADCHGPGTKCRVIQSIKCDDTSPNQGELCESDADCLGGVCDIPDGQAKKLKRASPDD